MDWKCDYRQVGRSDKEQSSSGFVKALMTRRDGVWPTYCNCQQSS
jgi:hypothetical protein